MAAKKENKDPAFDLYRKVEELLGIDLRSLGLFRILIGILIIVDLCIRVTSLGAHYTDAGVVPRQLVFEYGEQPWFFSFHMLSGDIFLQVVLFLLAGLSAFSLAIGYRSRIACFICWVLMLSLHVRNPFVNNLGDWLLVNLLFWGMFLPLGARFSIDNQLKPAGQKIPVYSLSIATLAVILQMCLVYFLSVTHKISPVWHTEGTAIQFALNLDRITSGLGQSLLMLPESWLQFMTFSTLFLERWGPVLVFFPWFIGPCRTGVACLFISFHIGLALFFELGLFPYICMAGWVLLLPAWYWDRIKAVGDWSSFLSEKVFVPEDLLIRLKQLATREIRVIPGITESLLSVFFLFCMLLSSMLYGGVMDVAFYDSIYSRVEPVVHTLNMRQRWDMFSPSPPTTDGWFVVVGYAEDGQAVNLFSPEDAVSWSRPASIAETYRNQRWRKYLEWVMTKGGPYEKSFVAYCESYGANPGSSNEVEEVAVYFMQERTLEDLVAANVIRRQLK